MTFKDHFGRSNEENLLKGLCRAGRLADFELNRQFATQGFDLYR
jgi:hypothetical protein